MATQNDVATSLRFQLANDAPARLAEAGANWTQPPMGFYYGFTPHSEISVDISIKASMLRVLQQDNATLPGPIWNGLAVMINTNTPVANAISTMTMAAAHEVPIA